MLNVVTDAGVEEMLDDTQTVEDVTGKEPRRRRVIIDFGQDDNGVFRLVIPSEVDSLPGLGKEVVLELTVRPSDFGRRTDAISGTANESERSISPIAGPKR
jgi:hypothetical protein